MSCNKGLHGALYKNIDDTWSCLICKQIINYNELKTKRKKIKSFSKFKRVVSGIWAAIKRFLKRG